MKYCSYFIKMIPFWSSFVLGINFLILVSFVNSADTNFCSGPRNYDFLPSRHKYTPTSLGSILNQQLLKYVINTIPGYANLTQLLQTDKRTADISMLDRGSHLNWTKKLFIRPSDVNDTSKKLETYNADVENFVESNFTQVTLNVPLEERDIQKIRLIMFNDIKFKMELECQGTVEHNIRRKVFEYKSEWAPDAVLGFFDSYKLQSTESSPFDIFIIERNYLMNNYEELPEFDYSTVKGIRNVSIWLSNLQMSDVSYPNENKFINELLINRISTTITANSDGTCQTLKNASPDFHVLENYFVVIVHRESNILVAFHNHKYDTQETAGEHHLFDGSPTTSAVWCTRWGTMPIRNFAVTTTGEVMDAISPFVIYRQVVDLIHNNIVTNAAIYNPYRCQLSYKIWISILESLKSSNIDVKDLIYINNKDVKTYSPLIEGVTVVDLKNKTVIKGIAESYSDVFPLGLNISNATSIMISRVKIHLQLNNSRYKSVGQTHMMAITSDVFRHCLDRQYPWALDETLIYRLPLADDFPIHVYVIEATEDDDVGRLFDIDFTKLITRESAGQENIWIPEVRVQKKWHRHMDTKFQYILPGPYTKNYLLQNISVQLTAANTNLGVANPTDKILEHFVYAVVHKDSGIVIATGFRAKALADSMREFALDFYSKQNNHLEKGESYATSAIGYYLHNFLIKYIRKDLSSSKSNFDLSLLDQYFNIFHRIKTELNRIMKFPKYFSLQNELFIDIDFLNKKALQFTRNFYSRLYSKNDFFSSPDSDYQNWPLLNRIIGRRSSKIYNDYTYLQPGTLSMVRLTRPHNIFEYIQNFSSGIIKYDKIDNSAAVVMVTDLHATLKLRHEQMAYLKSMDQKLSKRMMLVSTEKYIYPEPNGCLNGSVYYKVPLEEPEGKEFDLYVIMPADGDDDWTRNTNCVSQVDFSSLESKGDVGLWVPEVEILNIPYTTLKELIGNDSSYFEKSYIIQKVYLKWTGTFHSVETDPSPNDKNYRIASQFFWAVVSKNQVLWVHGYCDEKLSTLTWRQSPQTTTTARPQTAPPIIESTTKTENIHGNDGLMTPKRQADTNNDRIGDTGHHETPITSRPPLNSTGSESTSGFRWNHPGLIALICLISIALLFIIFYFYNKNGHQDL